MDDPAPLHLSVAATSRSNITNYGWAIYAADRAVAVRFIRGWKSRTLDGLFDEFGAALQFPYYFGENWPAFDECLSDLGWLPSRQLVIIIVSADQLLADEPIEMKPFWKTVGKAMGAHVDRNLKQYPENEIQSIRFILQCEIEAVEDLAERLTVLGVEFERLSLPPLRKEQPR